ncbi:MAG: PaaI family thioesterase [Desulfuromonadales bacterium]|nr:PaaI family thioesterase [Desulfuromonadales bacterium]
MDYKVVNGQHISKNCMVCGVANPFSLKTQFFETEEHEVVALFTPREEHQSYPGIAHGGISAALLDEVIGRAIMAHYDQNTFGVTVDLQVKYKKPVPLDVELKVVGRITRDRGRLYEGSGELYLPDGSVAVSAQGKYLKRNLEQITDSDFIEEEWFEPQGPLPEKIELP